MPSCFLKNPLPWMYVLGLLLVSNFFGYGFSSIIILTSILILSNLIFTTFSNQTPLPPPPPPPPFPATLQSTKLAVALAEPETQHIDQTKEEQEQDGQSKMSRSAQFLPQVSIGDGQGLTSEMRESWGAAREMPLRENYEPVTKIIDDKSFPSLIMLSESGRSSTSEDSEEAEYWPYNDQGDIFRSRENSDGSISDEDSLIEISLRSGVYIDHQYKEEEEEKDKKKLGFFKERKVCLAELVAEFNEMNEEDNLIEIDLSIGSIKCPRFEIQA